MIWIGIYINVLSIDIIPLTDQWSKRVGKEFYGPVDYAFTHYFSDFRFVYKGKL